jgi:NAD(P)-dependent dehydrogenase (short-subunit alcohol dehydrogenase family)
MKKNILITGATSGIGLTFLKKNISKDLRFYLIGRNFKKVNSFKKNIKNKKKINLISFNFNKSLKKFNFNKIPKLDYIVLSAGIAKYNLIKDFDEKIFDEVVAVNLTQTAKFIALLVKKNRINNNASIVTVSSISGYKMAFNFHFAYSISKAGLIGMTKSLAVELSPKSIRVNAVAPGMVNTPMSDGVYVDDYFLKLDKEKYPLGKRYARTSEISDVINFLLFSKSSFITGQTIVIDGGFTLTK